jgi:hypothetical protein
MVLKFHITAINAFIVFKETAQTMYNPLKHSGDYVYNADYVHRLF